MIETASDMEAAHYRALLDEGKDLEIKMTGSSMWPFIKDGQILGVRNASLEKIHRGDVILSYRHNRFTCHRVYRNNNDQLQTKADALIGFDAKIRRDDLLGKIVYKRIGGRLIKCDGMMSRIFGTAIVFLTFLWAPIIPILRKIKRAVIISHS